MVITTCKVIRYSRVIPFTSWAFKFIPKSFELVNNQFSMTWNFPYLQANWNEVFKGTARLLGTLQYGVQIIVREEYRTGTSLGTKLRFFDNRILAKKRKGSKTCASKRGFTEDNGWAKVTKGKKETFFLFWYVSKSLTRRRLESLRWHFLLRCQSKQNINDNRDSTVKLCKIRHINRVFSDIKWGFGSW